MGFLALLPTLHTLKDSFSRFPGPVSCSDSVVWGLRLQERETGGKRPGYLMFDGVDAAAGHGEAFE